MKRWCSTAKLYRVTTQKTSTWNITAVLSFKTGEVLILYIHFVDLLVHSFRMFASFTSDMRMTFMLLFEGHTKLCFDCITKLPKLHPRFIYLIHMKFLLEISGGFEAYFVSDFNNI